MPKKIIKKDSMGTLEVPSSAIYGAQTQRAVDNFPISGLKMPPAFLRTLALIKAACATVNQQLKLLEPDIAEAIVNAANKIYAGQHITEQFPIDVFQTGSGTSTNMNMNEVIASIASTLQPQEVHPNDHVNMGQSSNDVIPTTIHVSCCLEIKEKLVPALSYLIETIEKRAEQYCHVVKTGRTHLMDAMPLTLGQELSGWAAQLRKGVARIKSTQKRLEELALGGTAVGTGINAHPEFGHKVAQILSEKTGIRFTQNANLFEALSCQDAVVELSGQLRVVAVSLTKIAQDLRLMNSGPIAGLSEISLPAIQPGSSIMPGKVNPVIPEAIIMVAAQVIGNDTTVTIAGQGGNFQLNVNLPVIAYNILQSLDILANGCRILADKAIMAFSVNESRITDLLSLNPILITALNPVIGYEKGAEIAKKAYRENRSVRSVAAEMTDLSPDDLDRLLDPQELTQGGIKS
ncbi:MAG: fumarate hydratase class [Pseudomonadota bacterium]|jgi:fumarate hydratase class II